VGSDEIYALGSYTARFNNEKYHYEVEKLLSKHFSARNFMSNHPNYLLLFDDGKLIGITGLLLPEETSYNGFEVNWTCLLPEYRGKNLIGKLLERAIQLTPGAKQSNIYCSCWKNMGKSQVNLHQAMYYNGFQLVLQGRARFSAEHYQMCSECPEYKLGCTCEEWLYMRVGDVC